ncbi:MAG: mannose-1-phosphate guanylyltransferase [Anaerolineae bacterium]|nr:mannose-1-phosphate guanylyltransferase [Anaerolineae bacterium]
MTTMYAFIMAGGVGSRLWPRSRKKTPKQFLDLLSEETMLQDAYARLQPLVAPENILIGTGELYVPIVREQLPSLPAENVIVEPAGRGTAPAIGLGALHIQRRDPDATMAVVTADHHIGLVDRFQRVLDAAARVAQEGHLVTLGIAPSFPSTGYGYIQRGARLTTIDGFTIYAAERFTEKPDAATAEAFLGSGLYSWNSGMFIWQVRAIMAEFERQMPHFYAQLNEIGQAAGTPDAQPTLKRVWQAVEKQTIDYGIMENAPDVAVIPTHIGWNDIGSWHTLMELLDADADGNVTIGDHIAVDTHNTMVYSPKKLVATIGLDSLIIVETDDALLICPRDRCQEVRTVIDILRAQGRDDLL